MYDSPKECIPSECNMIDHVRIMCACGDVMSVFRNPWQGGSWHVNCECGRVLKLVLTVDMTIPNGVVINK